MRSLKSRVYCVTQPNVRVKMYYKFSMILTVLGLCACGGGSSSSTALFQYPLDSAFSAYGQMYQDFNLTATSGSNTYTLQISSIPGNMATFNGVFAFTTTNTRTLSENGTNLSTDVQTQYFTISPYTPLGSSDTNGQVTEYANQIALPELATVGQSGSFARYTTYTDSTKNTVYATATIKWSMETDPTQIDTTVAFACLKYVGTLNGAANTETDCYLIDQNGNVLTVQVTMVVNGVTLIFN
jgi:hypothetical protein